LWQCKKKNGKWNPIFFYGLVISDSNGHYIWLCSKCMFERFERGIGYREFPLKNRIAQEKTLILMSFLSTFHAYICVFLHFHSHFHLLLFHFPLYNFCFLLDCILLLIFLLRFSGLAMKNLLAWNCFLLRFRWSIVQCIGNAFNEVFHIISFFCFWSSLVALYCYLLLLKLRHILKSIFLAYSILLVVSLQIQWDYAVIKLHFPPFTLSI